MTILFRKLDTIRDRLSAWLIRTTHRECYRIGKKSGRYAELDRDIEDVSLPVPSRWPTAASPSATDVLSVPGDELLHTVLDGRAWLEPDGGGQVVDIGVRRRDVTGLHRQKVAFRLDT